jgi:single-strand DNA-binding protein
MAGFQQVIIVGNLGRDPDLRYTQGGIPVCTFNVAVTTRAGGGRDGQQQQGGMESDRQEKTTWFRVTAWRELGERCKQYLAKGRQVMVIGTVDLSTYTTKEGQPGASLELTARDVRFLGQRSDGDGGEYSGGYNAPAPGNVDDIPF